MFRWLTRRVSKRITQWLESEPRGPSVHLSDFERLRYELKPCDVILVEGRSRISSIIKTITLSNWTHAALYVGRIHDVEDPQTKELILAHYDGDPSEQLVIEALLGHGTIVAPLSKYQRFHLRICRPAGISRRDLIAVIRYAAEALGLNYDVRRILDLARFMFPYSFLPRRWRSSLFEHRAGPMTHDVCSSMIARAFHAVHFPVLPLLVHNDEGELGLYQRNFRLFTPKDFDESPYFEIIKYPMFAFDELAIYRNLPWNTDGVVCNDIKDCFDVSPDIQFVDRIHKPGTPGKSDRQSVNLLDDLMTREIMPST